MPPKTKRGRKTAKSELATTKLRSLVKKAISVNNSKMLEQKTSIHSASDGTQISHNNFITLDPNLLETTQGAGAGNNNTSNRIGDKITLKKIDVAMMVELNERYSDVSFRIMVVKMAKGDTLTTATLFNGLSGNKMLDTVNTERFSILYQKWFKITARNKGTLQNEQGVQSGYYGVGASSANQGDVQSRATRIIKFSIPYKKFASSGVITYENASSQVKFYDYKVILYSYSNWSTSDALGYNTGRLNDYIKTIKYTDA